MSADDPSDPTMENLMDLHQEIARSSIRTSEPGIITAYDKDTQRASVQLAIKSAHVDEEDNRVSEAVAEINDVVVAFMGNARGRITWPVAVGDTCLVLFCSSSLSQWLYQGGIVDPDSDHRHDVSDAICIVAGHDFAHVPTDAPDDAVVVHSEKILLGSSAATDPVALQSDLQAFADGIDAQIVIKAGIVLAGGPPAVQAASDLSALNAVRSALPMGWPVCSQKVKAE